VTISTGASPPAKASARYIPAYGVCVRLRAGKETCSAKVPVVG
jgi:hypothetical protein